MDASTCTLGVRYPDQTTANFQLSPYRYKKKHGHRRKPSKGRLPKIVNIEDCLEENHIIQPLGKILVIFSEFSVCVNQYSGYVSNQTFFQGLQGLLSEIHVCIFISEMSNLLRFLT
jgi:hypothetical protein